MNSIEINNLSFKYDENIILDNISFSIKSGKYTAILGQNGSGKSTLAKLIMGLLEMQEGTIIVQGVILSSKTISSIRNNLGIVFQNPDNQFIGASVKDDIAFGLENNCVASEMMDDIILKYASIVGMEDKLDFEPSKLSGGQKQRVAIAGVLAMNPKILILDEATSMLDPTGKNEINKLICSLAKTSNMTIISITHDIEEAANADEIIILDKGKVVECNTPQYIFNNIDMNALSLDIPFGNSLANALKEHNVVLNATHDIERMVNEICQLNLKK